MMVENAVRGDRPRQPVWKQKLPDLFGLDLRSLALFRLGLALIILADLWVRAGDLTAHYTDAGMMPRSLLQQISHPLHWSIYSLSGQPLIQAGLLGVAALLALALLVGYRTRFVTIASWAMLISLHNRNPVLIFAADDVIRALMFWAMFLPLGAHYSLDRALNSSPNRPPNRFFSSATLALTLQICFVYWFSAAFKAKSPNWFPDGTAVYYALSYDQYATPLGHFLLNFPPLLTFFTLTTFVLEWVGPLFLFLPVRTGWVRLGTVITFILLHIGFGLTLNIGIFPFLSVVGWLALLPPLFWDLLQKRFYGPEQAGLRIYYDADCGFCKKVVHLIRNFSALPDTPLLQAQDDPDICAAMERYNSWVVVDWQQEQHYKFEAIAYVCEVSPLLRPLVPLLRWKPVMAAGNRFYQAIANNRQTAGKFTQPLKYRPLEVRPSRPLNFVVGLLFLYTTVWNFKSLAPETFNRKALNSIDWVSRVLRLDQSWSIFAPGPPKDDGWYVIPGELQDGSQINLLTQAPITWEKPTLHQRGALYDNMQWRTFFINLNRRFKQKLYPVYAQYLCRDWNRRHGPGQQVKRFEVYWMDERTVPPGQPQGVEKKRTWEQSCSSVEARNK